MWAGFSFFLASLGHNSPQLAYIQPGVHLVGVHVLAQLQGKHEEAVKLGTSWGSRACSSGKCSRELNRAKQQS